jgi:hypothetical protein
MMEQLDNTVLLSAKDISEGVTNGYRDVPNVILGGFFEHF